jgi:hypothetical protein
MTALLKILIKLRYDSSISVLEAEQKILELFTNLDKFPSHSDIEFFLDDAINPLKKFNLSDELTKALIRSGANWAIREMRRKAYLPTIKEPAPFDTPPKI